MTRMRRETTKTTSPPMKRRGEDPVGVVSATTAAMSRVQIHLHRESARPRIAEVTRQRKRSLAIGAGTTRQGRQSACCSPLVRRPPRIQMLWSTPTPTQAARRPSTRGEAALGARQRCRRARRGARSPQVACVVRRKSLVRPSPRALEIHPTGHASRARRREIDRRSNEFDHLDRAQWTATGNRMPTRHARMLMKRTMKRSHERSLIYT
mmetsp:Transcript_19437/g.48279  ORF Transcript_19437/g.48279 Transcript_19437/m.48279 type:complete len:209 (+) Transcript_19437:94-720(+)